MSSWMELEASAPELAAAGRRRLVGADGVAIGFLATVGAKRAPHLSPVCPIFAGDQLYVSAGAHTPKVSDLRTSGAYVLHAFLGANDEEFQIGGDATEVDDPAERAAVHAAIPFSAFKKTDPIFRLSIERALWVYWERVGQPDTKPVRRRWVAPRRAATSAVARDSRAVGGRRATPEEYQRIDLRAHSLLAGVPLHDVWLVDLPGGGAGRTILDVRAVLSLERFTQTNRAARALFGFRFWLGRVFGWDREPRRVQPESFVERLTAQDREHSLVEPGTLEGAFRVLLVTPREAISEIQNATVHAFSVFALVEEATGYRLYLAIYVRPVGPLTAWYMRLIDPFRRLIIYPAMLRHIRSVWTRGVAGGRDSRP